MENKYVSYREYSANWSLYDYEKPSDPIDYSYRGFEED